MRRGWRVVVAAGLIASIAGRAAPVSAADKVLGSGSTFAEVVLDQWAGDVYRNEGLGVDYTGIGSVGGLAQFQQGVVDFASSDVPYGETETTTRAYAYTPIAAGGTAIVYNLVDAAGKRIDNLRLSPQTIAKIFFGGIDNWNDPEIVDQNPDLGNRLPDLVIKRAVRSSGSGTTGVFTDFLSTAVPDLWNDFVRRGSVVTRAGGNYTTDWPGSDSQFDCKCYQYAGSNVIAELMAQNTPGARGNIGYLEAAYAIPLKIPVVAVKNVAGNYVLPTARNVAVALLEATENGDGTQNLESVFVSPRPEAYPASSYNYLVLPTAGLSASKGETLARYLIYSVTAGQSKAAVLGYSPLPPNLVQFALNRVPLIPGAPAPPPLGDWGRFYEQLDVAVVATPDPAVAAAPAAGTPAPVAGNGSGGGGGGATGGDNTGAGAGAGAGSAGGGADPADAGGTGSDAQTPGADGQPAAGSDSANPADDGGAGQSTGGAGPGGAGAGATGTGAGGSTTTTVVGGAGGAVAAPDPTGNTSSSGDTASSADGPSGTVVVVGVVAGSPAGTKTAASGGGAATLGRGLKFDKNGNVVSRDGKKVPSVRTIGLAPLLGIAGILVGVVILPPLLVGTGLVGSRRRRTATGRS